MAKRETNKTQSNKLTDSSIRKLKLLVTIIDRSKTPLYLDVLEQFEINMQTVIYGKGTAGSEMLSYLGLGETEKAVILSFVREDNVKDVLETLAEKFEKVKNGKGIAYTIPLKSIIGVSIYQFLSNSNIAKKEGNNE